MKAKILKKALALLLVFCMAAGMLPIAAQAAEPITGTCGENVTWSLNLDTGALTISGSGDMEGYASSYNGFTANCAPWRDYKDSITSVVVEEGVTSIGAFAFFLANNLTQVSLPYGLLRIGDHAFAVCPNLTDIELPDSLTWINGAAFMEDVSVAEITLPHSLIQIGDHALQRLNMEMVTIPYSASQNHFMAFYSTNIQNFYAEPDNPVYTSVDGVLFSKDMKTLLVYPSANPRTSYAIPEGVTTIKASIWDGPDELTFPASFTTFEDFSGPQGLAASNYTVMAGNSAFSSLDGVLFDKDRSTLIRYPIGRTETSYRVPDGVTTVGPYGFTNAASLTSITIPASVTNLSLEYGSFDGCDSLTDIYFEGSAFQWSQINYTDYGFMDHRDPEHIINIHFGAEDKTYTVSYDPGEGTTKGDSMSPCVVAQGDTTTLLPSGGYYLAPTGKRFKSWEINGTEYLPGMTYTPIANVTATALWEDSSLPSGRCGENVYWDFDADTGTITVSGSGEMLYPTGGCVPWLEMKPSITHAVVEDGVTNLARGTFEDCVNLTDVTLADSIAQFGDSTFHGCDALKTVELPRGLTCLGASAFSGCDALEEITIPNTVTSIDNYAFHWCKSLREINIPSGVTSIGRWSFDYCTNLRSVTIPGSVKEIGEEAFYQDTNLESFVVEEGLERIGIRALSGCNALKNISLPGTVRGFDAGGCDALETVTLNEGTTYTSLSSCASLSTIYLPESLETIRLWTTAVPNDIYYAGSRLQWQHRVGRTMMDNKGNATSWPDIPVHYGNADVTYDRNGGTDGMPMMFVKKNTSLTLPVCRFVAPEGKTFKSWEVNGQEYQPGEQYPISDDTVLKALWEQVPTTPLTGTVAKGTYMDADGNMQSYEVEFDTPLTQTSGELAAGNYYLTDDLDLTSYLSVCDGVVRIDLAGHVLRGAGNTRTFWCHGNSNACSLEIYDSDANTDNVTHAKHYYTMDETNHCWLFDDAIPSETFVEGGVITGNGYSIVDVSWIKNSAKFVLYQGTLSGASHAISTQTGGYSEVNTAEVVKILIAGGAVKGNGQKSLGIPGCAAVESCGTFVMTGGEISNNAGTGVEFVDTFILRGGKISNNRALGVYAARRRGTGTPDREDMIMCGGEISGNSWGLWGGGIYMPFGEATLDMRGGQIVNNTVTNNEVRTKGGGIFTRGNISLSGDVVISGNTSNFAAPSNLFIDGGAKIYLLPESPLRADQKIGIALTSCYPADGVVSTGYDTTLGKTDPQGIFTNGWGETMGDANPTDYFTSDVAGYGIKTITVDDTTEVALVRTHTATFVADGVVAGTVSFFDGDTALIEPEVPAKAHYDGAWESYDLASATSNITVNAVYTQNNDHSASETAVVTAPTCLEGGYTTYTCSVCGNTRVEGGTAALGHDYQLNADKSVAATPGHDGYEYYECTRNPAHFYKTPIIAPIVTHTATFMVGDEIIDQVVFEEGAATLDEPALPQRPNYVGQWEPYDLAAATSDITVHGLYTPVDPDAVSDVDAGAKAEYENGEVTMELSARATSRTIKVVSEQTKPVDVVLVLDQSGSMAETLSSRDRQSKRDALVSCANSFVAELHKNAVDTGADHRVAVVGFAYSAYNKGNYKNTGLLATANGKIINYNSIKNSDYATALLPINNGGRINANVVTGINSIVADGATAADLGLKMARNIFAENPIQSERERIVIFITDGTPTSWGEDAELVRQTAAAAISEANMLKNGQGAKIYSVGVHANADPTVSFTSAKDGVTTNSRGQFASYDFNRFLHAVSSNYPNAAAMSNLGTGNKADGYYMGVKDTSNLGSIFTNILYSTVYELKSFDKATLYYTLSPEFTLTMEQELAMREELRAQGLADSDIQVIRNQDGTTQLRFQNVKAQAVYGEDGTLHYEAKVRFKVSANQSAPAGGSVSTGTGSNGVEYEGSQIASLETPMVSIPQNRCLVAFTINGQVYQLREMAAGEVITLPDTELASWSVPAGAVVSGGYAVFEADSAPEQKHTIRWIIDGTEMVEQYALGQVIVPPAVPVKEGYDFTGWSRSIPHSMPAYDLVCEAIYSPAHTHSFELAYQTGSCREGLTIVYRCACGETQSMTERPAEHNFVAVLVDNGSTGTEVEKVVCTKCGHSEEQNINFKVSYSTGWKTTVLDLNLLQNEVNVVQPEAEIEMRFFVGEDGGRLYTVTRIDSDGKRTTYQTRAENGYLVFRANHFSIYVISELDETTSQPTETVSYEEAVNILDSKVDATPTAPLDGTSSSDNNRPSNGGSTRPTAKPAEETPVFSFADVAEQDWYYDSAKYVYEKGLMQGVSATAFAPDQTTSRAMITTILWRLAGSPAMGGGKSGIFPDVPEDEWYTEAVEWAAVRGVVKGHEDGKFRPTDPITREQLAAMLYRYAGNPATAGTLDGFVDMNKASDYALDALRWATDQGILTGKGGGILDPQGQATRAEIATILMRYCENKK